MSRRVAITGVGALTPLGVGAAALIERWSAGECGIEDGFSRCREFEPLEFLAKKDQWSEVLPRMRALRDGFATR